MRDSIRIVAALYLNAPSQKLTSINSLLKYKVIHLHNTVKIRSDKIELAGEYQDEELLLWGHGDPLDWNQWSCDLKELISKNGTESYQIDLFEEDGRLIRRITG